METIFALILTPKKAAKSSEERTPSYPQGFFFFFLALSSDTWHFLLAEGHQSDETRKVLTCKL